MKSTNQPEVDQAALPTAAELRRDVLNRDRPTPDVGEPEDDENPDELRADDDGMAQPFADSDDRCANLLGFDFGGEA